MFASAKARCGSQTTKNTAKGRALDPIDTFPFENQYIVSLISNLKTYTLSLIDWFSLITVCYSNNCFVVDIPRIVDLLSKAYNLFCPDRHQC